MSNGAFTYEKPDGLNDIVNEICKRLEASGASKSDFFAKMRQEVKSVLASVTKSGREMARGSVLTSDRGNAAKAIGFGAFGKSLGGSVQIEISGRRKESSKRPYRPGRLRDVSARTKQINEYYGRDRAFILRFLNSGTNPRMATADVHGRGSRASWGARGSIAGSNWFENLAPNMSNAAERLGIKAEEIGSRIVEEIINQSK